MALLSSAVGGPTPFSPNHEQITGQRLLHEDGVAESATLKERCEVRVGCSEAWMPKRATMSCELLLERMDHDFEVPGNGHEAPGPAIEAYSDR